MIRLILCGLWALGAFIFSLPFHARFRHLAKIGKEKESWNKAWKYVRGFFRGLLFFAGTRMDIRGAENLPKDTPALYVGNHRSYFDIITLQTLSPVPMAFVAKKEFLKYPFLNLYMTDIGCIFLDRENPKAAIKTISEGTRRLKEGLSMGLFPEGTRNHGEELLPFKEGGYRMAEKSGRPIIVTALTGMDNIFEANKNRFIKKQKVIIEFSKPVYVSEMSKEERKAFYDSIPGQIEEMLKAHKA